MTLIREIRHLISDGYDDSAESRSAAQLADLNNRRGRVGTGGQVRVSRTGRSTMDGSFQFLGVLQHWTSQTKLPSNFAVRKSKIDTHDELFPLAPKTVHQDGWAPLLGCTQRTVTPAARVVSGKRLSDDQMDGIRFGAWVRARLTVNSLLPRMQSRNCHVLASHWMRHDGFARETMHPNAAFGRFCREHLERETRSLAADPSMALNRAQLLVHDDEALAQFRVDYRIPDDLVIERLGPNDDADWVEGEGNRIPIRTCVSELCSNCAGCGCPDEREGLEFTTEDLFHMYCIVKPRKNSETQMLEEFPAGEPDLFYVPRYRGYVHVGFNARFWRRSNRCSAAISAVNNCGRSRKIRVQAPRQRSLLSDEVSELFEGTSAELRRLLEETDGESLDSSELSSSSWDVDLGNEGEGEEAEVEDGEEVDQALAADPFVTAPIALLLAQPQNANLIIVESSDSDRADGIAIVEPKEIVEHSYNRGSSSSSSSQGSTKEMAPRSVSGTPELWTPQFTVVELGKHVTFADTIKDHETCVALGNAMMLPQDVADHAAESSAEFGGKVVMLGAHLFQRAVSTSLQLKQGAVDLKMATQKANSLEKELEASEGRARRRALFDRAFERVEDAYEKQCFSRRMARLSEEARDPPDHLAWVSPAPLVQLPASPGRYSPIVLPNFDEEEYAT
ncbi:hypothetical protein Acr_00g0019510 [Actinidia rufa]|uniref:Uncharacterized protein n=1 Tax=Actinidia rufa TaxID=165716 RepID=A0A7J0DBQ8_9ERIC|nr:hypothetical protein Acr_00g0019510 [Actinidia rufa]